MELWGSKHVEVLLLWYNHECVNDKLCAFCWLVIVDHLKLLPRQFQYVVQPIATQFQYVVQSIATQFQYVVQSIATQFQYVMQPIATQ